MALGILVIVNIVSIVIAIGFQILLYKTKSSNSIFIINMLFSLLLSYLAFTAMPTNFTVQRTIAILMGVIAVLAIVMKFRSEKLVLFSKVILSISIVVNFMLLF